MLTRRLQCVSVLIGKRYRRQDEIGTPFCVTIDQQSLQDRTVTVRHRDSMQQIRLAATELVAQARLPQTQFEWLA